MATTTIVPPPAGIKAQFGSDVIVDVLRALDLRYLAINPGATYRGLHDSVVNYAGDQEPQFILCNHENIALSLAAGYGIAAGKPMGAIVHDIVGLLNAANGIYSAWLAKSPVIIMGGTGPMAVERRRPWIDWVHTALVQGNAVRDFIKWDDQPATVFSAVESLLRGYQLATAAPKGPVYICFDADLQEQALDKPIQVPDVSKFVAPTAYHADPRALDQAARMLVEAQNPICVVDHLESAESMPTLVQLADALAMPVIDGGRRVNFPNTHSINLSGLAAEALPQADLVLSLNTDDLFNAITTVDRPTRLASYYTRPGVKIVDISLRHLAWRSWSQEYGRLQPTDLVIGADADTALPGLLSRCQQLLAQDARKAALPQRRQRWEAMRSAAKQRWAQQAEKNKDASPIALSRFASEIWSVIKDEDWVLVNGTLNDWVWRTWDFTRPYQYIYREGLGCGLGNALGAALAHRDQKRLVLDIQPDGDMLFTSSALWTAVHSHIPLLVVMFNNRSYFNDEVHQEVVARTRERPVGNKWVGMRIDDPPVNFAKLAESFGAYGQGPIEDPAQIGPALGRAIKHIKQTGQCALVDVITQAR